MKIIVITPPAFIREEPSAIVRLLDHGVWAVHLRKPDSSVGELAELIRSIPAAYHSRLVLHDHFDLCADFGLRGVHLNRRNPNPPLRHRGTLSCSTHSFDELNRRLPEVDYAFLSPIYDSISKQGYASGFTPEQLRSGQSDGLIGPKVFALGGVTADRLVELESYGFGGAALLGEVWNRVGEPDFEDYVKRLTGRY